MSYDNRAAVLKDSVLKVPRLFRRTMVMEPPSPMHVGREFVRQYYTLLNQVSMRKDVLPLPEKYLRVYKKYFIPGAAASAPILLPQLQLRARRPGEQ